MVLCLCKISSTNNERILFEGDTTDVTIKNNIISDVAGHDIYSQSDKTYSHVLIEDNLIDGVGTGMSGMFAMGDYKDGSVISGNNITNIAYGGISINGATNLTINGNDISNTISPGIQIAGASGDITISGNTITDTNTGNTSDKGGISLYGPDFVGPVTVTNNTISHSYNGVSIRAGKDITGKTINVNNNKLN